MTMFARGGRAGFALSLPELSSRLKQALGLRGAPPLDLDDNIKAVIDLTALEDVAYADQPVFWVLSGSVAGVAAQFSYVGVRAGTKKVTVDGCVITNETGAAVMVQVLAVPNGSGLASDTLIWAANRPGSTTGNPLPPASRRVISNSASAFGQEIARARLPIDQTIVVPVKWRLGLGDEVLIRPNATLVVGSGTLFGREYPD